MHLGKKILVWFNNMTKLKPKSTNSVFTMRSINVSLKSAPEKVNNSTGKKTQNNCMNILKCSKAIYSNVVKITSTG